MAPEIISLLSSEAEPVPPSSPLVYTSVQTHQARFADFSDEIEILPAPKRRRCTPPPSVANNERDSRIEESREADKGQTQAGLKLKRTFDDDDPIIFSSSPALPIRNETPRLLRPRWTSGAKKDVLDDLFGSNLSSDGSPAAVPTASLQFTSRTAALLAELDSNRLAGRKPSVAGKDDKNSAVRNAPSTDQPGLLPIVKKPAPAPLSSIEDSSQPVPAPRHLAKAPAKKRRANTPERERIALDKALEKENIKAKKAAEREAAKIAKARERQLAADLAEVNKARHDKKISVTEMIVCIPSAMDKASTSSTVAKQLFQQLGVRVESVEATQGCQQLNTEADTILWKRRSRARFDEEAGHWVPLERVQEMEEMSHMLCILEASRFIALLQKDVDPSVLETLKNDGILTRSDCIDNDLDAHIAIVKSRWPSRRPIYIIEGLEAFLRKARNSKNRSYQAAVRAQTQGDAVTGENASEVSVTNKRKKTKASTPSAVIDEEAVEEALLRLQMQHRCLIHHTSATAETAEWIVGFTQHVSTIPYKMQNKESTAEASFCMDVGQVKTGDDKDDTYVKMLQEIVRVTLPVAYGITARYSTIVELLAGMKREGPLFCQDLKKCSNKNGAFTEARIGPALSRRIYKIFTGDDPDSMDV